MKFYFFLSCLFISSGIFAQNRDTIFLVRRIADTPYTFYHAVFIDTSMKFNSELTDFSFNKYDSLIYYDQIPKFTTQTMSVKRGTYMQATNESAFAFYVKLGFTVLGKFEHNGYNYDMIFDIN